MARPLLNLLVFVEIAALAVVGTLLSVNLLDDNDATSSAPPTAVTTVLVPVVETVSIDPTVVIDPTTPTGTSTFFIVQTSGRPETEGKEVYLQQSVNFSDSDLAFPPLPEGTPLEQIGPDATDDFGAVHHHVRGADGREGRVRAEYTVPAS
jgi:hypothetical protein